MKILICCGTRPETIKMAPIIIEMVERGLNPLICTTAQHREMLDQMLRVFSLKPDFDLNLMTPGQTLNGLSSAIFSEMDKVFDKTKPDVVLIQGDTTTATISAQAAFHRQIKIAHIEAGLRTYQRYSPFPEEINRQLISRLANYHFTPTASATQNLISEGVDRKAICESGNTVVDALKLIEPRLKKFNFPEELGFNPRNFEKLILVTGHRRENYGKGLEEICKALTELAKNPNYLIVFPVHLNPKIKMVVEERLKGYKNIILLPPVRYDQLLALLETCDLVISDSGGIQEEAPTFKKAVIVTREFTERREAVDVGFSVLTGAVSDKILESAYSLLKKPPKYKNFPNPFGDGQAAMRIVNFLEKQV